MLKQNREKKTESDIEEIHFEDDDIIIYPDIISKEKNNGKKEKEVLKGILSKGNSNDLKNIRQHR